jgi:hypothetical protein
MSPIESFLRYQFDELNHLGEQLEQHTTKKKRKEREKEEEGGVVDTILTRDIRSFENKRKEVRELTTTTILDCAGAFVETHSTLFSGGNGIFKNALNQVCGLLKI